jgi:hypothetical protein
MSAIPLGMPEKEYPQQARSHKQLTPLLAGALHYPKYR